MEEKNWFAEYLAGKQNSWAEFQALLAAQQQEFQRQMDEIFAILNSVSNSIGK